MRVTLFTIGFLLAIKVFSQDHHDLQLPKTYVAHFTNEPVKIDGLRLENLWEKSEWTDLFEDITGKTRPKFNTRVKMLWDSTYWYFYAEMQEPHVWADLKQRDTIIFYNNDFEVFIDPDHGDTHNYYELEINALNTVWDLFLTRPYRNGSMVLDSWDIQGLKTAVDVRGTLNDPNDIDAGWAVEIAIPWSVLIEASRSNRLPISDFWRLNFSRVNWEHDVKGGKYFRKKDEDGNYLPEFNWVWSPQEVINMHEPERWGYVYFSPSGPNQVEEFITPREEHIKWHLYALFRKVRKGNELKADAKSYLENVKIEGTAVEPRLEVTSFGWYLWARDPNSNQRLIIDQYGKFRINEH